jgi:hypothetical protein
VWGRRGQPLGTQQRKYPHRKLDSQNALCAQALAGVIYFVVTVL